MQLLPMASSPDGLISARSESGGGGAGLVDASGGPKKGPTMICNCSQSVPIEYELRHASNSHQRQGFQSPFVEKRHAPVPESPVAQWGGSVWGR